MHIDQFTERHPGPKQISPEDAPPGITQERVLDAIAQTAFTNLRTYSNCARSTLWALQTHLCFPDAAALRAVSALAGGIGGTGETCGAVIGALSAVGLRLGSDAPHDAEAREVVARAVRRVVDELIALYGTTRCYGIQEHLIGWACDDPSKEEAWREARGQVACATVCAEAARITARVILDTESSAADS